MTVKYNIKHQELPLLATRFIRSTSDPVPAGPTCSVRGTDVLRAGGGGRPMAVGNFWTCGRASPDDDVGKVSVRSKKW